MTSGSESETFLEFHVDDSRMVNLRHYAARTINTTGAVGWEAVALDLLVGCMLGVFAWIGYVGKMLILLLPCGFGAVVCISLSFYGAYGNIRESILARRQRKSEQESPAE